MPVLSGYGKEELLVIVPGMGGCPLIYQANSLWPSSTCYGQDTGGTAQCMLWSGYGLNVPPSVLVLGAWSRGWWRSDGTLQRWHLVGSVRSLGFLPSEGVSVAILGLLLMEVLTKRACPMQLAMIISLSAILSCSNVTRCVLTPEVSQSWTFSFQNCKLKQNNKPFLLKYPPSAI